MKQTIEEQIEKLERGLRVPGTIIARALMDEGLGWSVTFSDLATGMGSTYYDRTIFGALQKALDGRHRLAQEVENTIRRLQWQQRKRRQDKVRRDRRLSRSTMRR
jgi:hypothetical protein